MHLQMYSVCIVLRQSSSVGGSLEITSGASVHTDNKQQALTPLYLPPLFKTKRAKLWPASVFFVSVFCICVSKLHLAYSYIFVTLTKEATTTWPDHSKTCFISCGLRNLCVWCLFKTTVFCVLSYFDGFQARNCWLLSVFWGENCANAETKRTGKIFWRKIWQILGHNLILHASVGMDLYGKLRPKRILEKNKTFEWNIFHFKHFVST